MASRSICGDWWFNVRKSNTEPMLRLNLEAPTPSSQEKLEELKEDLGSRWRIKKGG